MMGQVLKRLVNSVGDKQPSLSCNYNTIIYSWMNVQNPELQECKSKNLQYAYKKLNASNLNG